MDYAVEILGSTTDEDTKFFIQNMVFEFSNKGPNFVTRTLGRPLLMKDYGFLIMGERSGGDACCIQAMQTADGQNYAISTYRDRSTDMNFVNNDTGIAPTEGYAFDYEHFYDLDYLTTKMQQ